MIDGDINYILEHHNIRRE